MKILITLFIILCSFSSLAQPPAAGTVSPNPNLDKFIGTWKWNDSNGDELTIRFKKVSYYFSEYSAAADVIMGTHRYIKNGVVIEDNMSSYSTLEFNLPPLLLLYGRWNGTYPNYIRGSLIDQIKNKTCNLDVDYIFGTVPILKWYLRDRKETSMYQPGQPSYDFSVTLPEEIYLIKQ